MSEKYITGKPFPKSVEHLQLKMENEADIQTKTRKRKKEQVQKKEEEDTKPSRLQYRSTLASIVRLLHNVKFNEAQKEEIQKSPFATMLLAITDNNLDKQTVKKYENNILSLIQRYKKNEGRFMLGEKSVRITYDEIGLIFGITSGTRRILLGPQTKKPDTAFVNRNFDRTTRMNYAGMKDRITTLIHMPSKGKKEKGLEQEAEKDLARMLTLYVLGTVFFKTTGPNFNWSYIEFVENLEECNKYAWSKYITDFLVTELDKKCENPATVGGCAVALLYWFCEHTKIMEPSEPHVPRFMKWKLNELDAKLFEMPVDKILPDMVIDSELKPTDEEKALFTILREQPIQAPEIVLELKPTDEEKALFTILPEQPIQAPKIVLEQEAQEDVEQQGRPEDVQKLISDLLEKNQFLEKKLKEEIAERDNKLQQNKLLRTRLESRKASVAELRAQLDEERDQRREEREKAGVDLKISVQRVQTDAQEELKGLSDTALRREREQQEEINKLQEVEKEGCLLVETLRSKLEESRQKVVLSDNKVRQLEAQICEVQLASASERKRVKELEHVAEKLRKELESEKAAGEEAWAKMVSEGGDQVCENNKSDDDTMDEDDEATQEDSTG
ncbi:hypothetical protein Vadar_023422 [Vaccinium darrowii]|uniref:Uncharacterized protein n=1 Tax=Vaccinium darrowii TaxID=229202 RepID=A0ACB7XSI9_9ERIC|nr:hypothetical protein Vadar_023422 [Vaccinium darrowii]